MSDIKKFVIKIMDDLLVFHHTGNIGDIEVGDINTCTINGVMKGTGMVIKGSFREVYHDIPVTHDVLAGEAFSNNMGSASGVTVMALEDNSESLLVMPRPKHPGGVWITEYGKLLTGETADITGDYLVVFGAGIVVDGKSYPEEDGFKVSEPKTIQGMEGETYYMSVKSITNTEEFISLRSAIDQNDPAVI